MKLNIICVGKLREKYLIEAGNEYLKRLQRFCEVKITELSDEKDDDPNAIEIEGKRILDRIEPKDYIICLCIEGKQFDSIGFSRKITETFDSGRSTVDFIIGGSLGLSKSVKDRGDLLLSFSKMTFTHQMMRVILLEQIYRAFKIEKNETYHK
ncbi:MAG: 23S rRNA (pseudouridine(1915)-N(3))-methyltransferase RlmH [Clostridia bacterium]|jgi:23S rRNA (pseudouridine1915-N3)-methyltransferase